jgi:hypothetical protein
MPKRKFPLETGGTPRVEVEWKAFWKNTTVRVDGREVGQIANKKMLDAGQEFPLEDGSVLKVQLAPTTLGNAFTGPELLVSHNGQPVPGSGSDPVTKLSSAYGVVYFIGGFNILVGILTLIFNIELFGGSVGGGASFLYGGIFLALGYFVQKQHSIIALGLAVGLFTADSIATLGFRASEAGSTAARGGYGFLVVRIIFIIVMCQGFGAIRQFKQQRQ